MDYQCILANDVSYNMNSKQRYGQMSSKEMKITMSMS